MDVVSPASRLASGLINSTLQDLAAPESSLMTCIRVIGLPFLRPISLLLLSLAPVTELEVREMLVVRLVHASGTLWLSLFFGTYVLCMVFHLCSVHRCHLLYEIFWRQCRAESIICFFSNGIPGFPV